MRKLKTLLLAALSLVAIGFVAPKTVTAAAETRDFWCEYSARPADKEYMTYGSQSVTTYTAEEAAAAGIPEGYENEVFSMVGAQSCGVFLDFSQEQVSVSAIESLQFRIYIVPHEANTGGKPQARITDPTSVGNAWVYQPGNTPTPTGEWTTVTVPYNDRFVNMSKNGILDKFEFAVRMNVFSPVYVDSIQYVLKGNDGVAPVINYHGEDTIAVELGSALNLNVSAFDAGENRSVAVEYIWQDGVTLNANGTPNAEGTYTLTLQAVDSFGCVAQKVLTVNVIEADDIAPVINVNFDTVKAKVGTKPLLNATATDNNGTVTLTKVWSDGALDGRGRLTEGTHTWTLTAVDAFDNTTRKTVTFIVTAEEPLYDLITDEETATPKCTVTFDGDNAVTVGWGFTVAQPDDPIRETTAEASYTFIGWYYGEEEWDFSTPVTEDMNIESKWEVNKRKYRVAFDNVYDGLKVAYGDVIPADKIPADPIKNMDERYTYVFVGWYNGDELWNFETSVVTGETYLVSKYEQFDRLYKVTFDGENEQQLTYGAKIEAPADPIKEGYIFDGWYMGATKWNFDKDTLASNLYLTSKWIAVEPPQDEDGDDSSKDDDQQSATDSTLDSTTDSTPDSASDTAQPGNSGCFGMMGGIAGGMTALGVAILTLLKKKND